MNAYAKFVLIPQQEYTRLKKPSQTKMILESKKPDIMKRSQIAKNLKFKDPPPLPPAPIFGENSNEDEKVQLKDIQDSNLPEPIKSKLSDDLLGNASDETSMEFMPSHYSTPRGSFSGMLDLEATSSGRLVDRRGKTVPKSNIKTVKNFLLSSKSKKQPPGTQAALDKLKERPELLKRIRNPVVRKKLGFNQSGSGWISIKKF